MQTQLTDQERVALAKLEYQLLVPGQPIQVDGHALGEVLAHIYEPDGFQLFVIGHQAAPRELILLFKGSSGVRRGNPTTWNDEWLATNLPLLQALLRQHRQIPSQLQTAARVLNSLLRQYRRAKFFIYGHSLGAINAQFALANCHHLGRIKHAWLYEGANLYPLLTTRERRRVRKYRSRIDNYIDIFDPVTLGYTNPMALVGRLRYVASERCLLPISQHMWAGYRFNAAGQLQLRALDADFWRTTQREQELINTIATLQQWEPTRRPAAQWAAALRASLPAELSLAQLIEAWGATGWQSPLHWRQLPEWWQERKET